MLEDLKETLTGMKKENEKLKVIAISGLCVSKAGIGLFENKFGCKERGYVSDEYILRKKTPEELEGKQVSGEVENPTLVVVIADTEEEMRKKEKEDNLVLLQKVKMLKLYENESSFVWDYLKL